MLFRVDPASGVGLADQIAAQVRGAIISGEVDPGATLPPARQVAAGLDVNMHTVLRAYARLRDEGVIDLRRGRGAVVRADLDRSALTLNDSLTKVATLATRLGWSPDRAATAMRGAMEALVAGSKAGGDSDAPT